jgi:hypothetical protein
MLVVAALLVLAFANIAVRSSWSEVEDGVLWVSRPEGVVAAEIDVQSAAGTVGILPGDLLLAINGKPVDSPDAVLAELHISAIGDQLDYIVFRSGSEVLFELTPQPIPAGNRVLYFVLATVGVFTLLMGALVRLRRPAVQATLHFFWLTVAFFGVLTFSFSGRLDRLDWIFYWLDVIATLMLPPLFIHFALIFPERSTNLTQNKLRPFPYSVLYLPALVIGLMRIVTFSRSSGAEVAELTGAIESLERLELGYLAVCLMGGAAIMFWALRRARSVTARRQLRWILWGTVMGGLPFLAGYLLPFALGFNPASEMQLTAIPLGLIPLSFASAVVSYRLMDVEVIIKRSVAYTTVLLAMVVIYAVLLRVATAILLGGSQQHNSIIALLATLVVVLLASPVKDLIQSALDRVYYRDRYDYRRALVGFARDLNRDLNLARLSERLVTRVMDTFVVDRMALMLAPADDGSDGHLRAIHAAGVGEEIPRVSRRSPLGEWLWASRTVVLDDTAWRLDNSDVEAWRDVGIHYLIPSVSKDGTTAVLAVGRKDNGEPLSSEDLALLAAVAAQVATALENGRLYGQLRAKASELDRLREFSENVIESLNDGLAVIDFDGRVIRWNRGLEQLYGVERGKALGERLDSLFEPVFVQMLQEVQDDRRTGSVRYRLPLQSRHSDGPKRLLVNLATAPLRTPQGESAGTIVILENITERVQLEEQLQISEKMASIGLLAAGVAHEVNTPLTGISSFTQMLLEGAETNDPKTRLLQKIERQTIRAAKIVNGLLDLARPARTETGPVNVNAVINDVLSLLEHQLKESHISVRKELGTPAPIALGLDYKLQQVFLNLFLNARDAMPNGGWLRITTRRDGDRATIEIADTGSGISGEHLSRIYDPFFTTKSLGRGTGLGLSITYGIVQEHSGSIECDSVEGQGTKFTLDFPFAASALTRSDEVAQ